jgi:hypothetical protein
MNVYERLAHRSVSGLVRLACALALVALAIICFSVLYPRPLPVILAMSVGHAIGGAAFACYLLAVVLDATRRPPPPDSLAPAEVAGEDRTSDDGQTSNRTPA